MFTHFCLIPGCILFSFCSMLFPSVSVNAAQTDTEGNSIRSLSSERDTSLVKLYSQQSRKYLNYKPDSALFFASQALKLAEQLNFQQGIAQSYNDIAATMFYNGNFNRALELHLKALQIREKTRDSLGISSSYINIGIVYDEMGDYSKSIAYNRKAIEIDKALKNFEALSIDYLNIGEDYLTLNMLDSALHYTQSAFSMTLKAKSSIPVLPNILHNLGLIQKKMNNPELAMAHFREALRQSLLLHDSKQLAEVSYELALMFLNKNQTDSALFYLRKTLNMAEAMNYRQDAINAGELLSKHYEVSGLNDSALYYLKLTAAAKDSIFSHEKYRQAQSLTFNEQLRQQDIEEQKAKAAEARRNNLQYIGIGIFIILFFLLILLLSKIKTNERLIESLGLLGLMLLFEFITVLIDPIKGKITHHIPVFLLLISVCIAAILLPIHHRLTNLLKKKLVRKPAQN